MSTTYEFAPQALTGGRHALPVPDQDEDRDVVDGVEHDVPASSAPDPGTSDVTEPIHIPEQYRRTADARPAGAVRRQATGLAMKKRNPLAAWIGLPMTTLGVYTFVWYYKIHREMADFDRRRPIPVIGPVLVLVLLGWTVVAPLVSLFHTGRRIADAQRTAGLRPTCSPAVGVALFFCFGLVTLYYQQELNKIVDAYRAPAGREIVLCH